ncbi:hypothetical protein PVAP13_9NG608414 [Panicum virgatum]|uniref:Uncharacterized protein n=1 Tax=Panicum virgatum TaxID=38727 RepID=A0A8T0MZV0_PANVG|nr:hypothetical protein PVAP13_9NG608414 [Panicum virgatum]
MNCSDSGKWFLQPPFPFLGGSLDLPGLEYSSVFSRSWRTATWKGLVLLGCGADEKEMDDPWTVVGLTARSPLLHCPASS